MRAALMAGAVLAGLLGAAGCMNFDMPSKENVEQIFVSEQDIEVESDVVPASVPVMQATELGGWRVLCEECHNGPHYSSHTILNWGHRDDCLAQTTCLQCHGEELHRMDVRGNKQLCYDCHLAQGVPTNCSTCHTAEHIARQPKHDAGFLGTHGKHVAAGQYDCFKCHGSERWCLDCHGLPMPHPQDIIKEHPKLVQGQPQVCANCHGQQSCVRCHKALNVSVRLK